MNRIPHFVYRSWKIGTCPTSACLCLSWLNYPCAECCPENMLKFRQQTLLMRTGRSQCRWTVKENRKKLSNNIMQYHRALIKLKSNRDSKVLCECVFTHLPLVWTGPKPLIATYSLKYWGIEKPINMEKPSTNFVRKLLRLQNWRKLRPDAPAQT